MRLVVAKRDKLASLIKRFCFALSLTLLVSVVHAANISGSVWNDINTDTLKGDSTNNLLGTNVLSQSDLTQIGNLGANTYGDPTVPNAGVEAGFSNVRVCLRGRVLDPPLPFILLNECTTTDSNGNYSFDNVPDGTGSNLRLVVVAPSGFKFSSDDPAGDNDADQDPVAPVPPDPWKARIPLNYTGADISDGTDAGLRPVPEINLAYVDLNAIPGDGIQGIETGTPSYNVLGNCTTTAPYLDPADPALNSPTEAGDDCHKFDDTVRTNDLVTITPSITLDNAPSGGIDNVVLEMQFSPVDGASLEIESASSTGIPTSCLTGASVDPQSQVINHADGSITLICNMGNIQNAQLFAPISIKPTGDSPNGSSFKTEIRAYAAANDAIPSDELPVPEIAISAAPRFDLSKNSGSASSPPNRVINAGNNLTRVNPVTGVTEGGKAFRYELSIVADGDGKGSSALSDPITFEEIIDPRYAAFGAHMYFCEPNPYQVNSTLPTSGAGSLPFDDAKTANSGTWDCPAGTTAVTINGADTSGTHFPSEAQNGNSTAPWKYVATGQVRVWYPFSAFYRFAGPDGVLNTADDGTVTNPNDPSIWQPGDPAITGTYPITNCVGNFDPNSAPDINGNTVSNYGNGYESGWDGSTATGNNCRNHSYTISVNGSFTKRYGGDFPLYGSGGHRFANAPTWTWACTGQPDRYIVEGQTACSTGDGPVVESQNFTATPYLTAESSQADLSNAWLCETIDNATYKLAPIPTGSSAGDYAFAIYHDLVLPAVDGGAVRLGYEYATDHGFILEYGRFTAASGQTTWQINHAAGPPNAIDGTIPVTNPQQQLAAKDCGETLTTNGHLEWSVNQAAFPVDDIVLVRMRPDPNRIPVQALGLGDRMILNLNFEARNTFYAPDVPAENGLPIPTGTLLPNVSNFAYDRSADPRPIDFGTGGYEATNHSGIDGATTTAYGDRLIFQSVFVAIEKQAYRAFSGSPVGADDLLEEFAGDPIMWSLHPSVTAINNQAVAKNVVITDVLPEYTSYAASCSPPLPAGVSGPQIIPNMPNAGETTLIYTYDAPELPANQALAPISICANTDAFAPAPVDVLNKVKIEASNVAFTPTLQQDERAVRLLQRGRFAVKKEVDFPLDFQDQDQLWTLIWANTSDQVPFAPPDLIDVFPFIGDGPGALAERETFASDYSGMLSLTAIPVAPSVSGGVSPRTDIGQWYVTCDDPATVNPDAANAAYNDLTTGSTNWIAAVSGSTADPSSTCSLANVKAIRWVSAIVLAPQETGKVDFTVQAVGNAPNDIYVNRYTGYTASFLNKPVRSNEPFVQVIGFSLGDLIWLDINDNGIFDEGLDISAPAGVTVNLYQNNMGMVGTTTTDAQGRWFFEELSGGQYSGGTTYVAGEYYVEVTGLPIGWVVNATSATFAADPNNNLNEDTDHHTLLDMGTVIRSSGMITLSASILQTGEIIGDEPIGENVKLLGDPLVRDDLSNFSLDLMLVPLRGDIKVIKEVEGGGPIDGWQFTLASVDLTNCPLPSTLINPGVSDTDGEVLFEDLLVYNTAQAGVMCDYTIIETQRTGWSLATQVPAGPYQVVADGTIEVTITNERDTGSIAVTKTVDGNEAPQGWEFEITSLATNCELPVDPYTLTTTDGSGGTVTFTDVPTHASQTPFEQCEYEITETAQTGWTMVTSPADLTSLVVLSGETTQVDVENGQDVGEIAVTKIVNGLEAPTGWVFELTSLTDGCVIPSGVSPQTTADGSGGLVTFSELQTHSSTLTNTGCLYQIAETAQTGWSQVTDATNLTDLSVVTGQPTQVSVENSQWPDLVVEKSVDPQGVLSGGELTFTIDVLNDGVLPATLVQLTDVLPAGLVYVSDVASQGGFDSTTGHWLVGTLIGGEVASLSLTVRLEPVAGVCAAEYDNSVSVTSQGEVDFDPNNHSDDATAKLISIASAKALSDNSPVALGNGSYQVTYSILITNTGGIDLTNIQVEDDLLQMINTPLANNATYEMIEIFSPDLTLTPNPNFNGSSNKNLLQGIDTLVAGASGKISVTIKLTPDVYFGPFMNQAKVLAQTSAGIQVEDLSENGKQISTSFSFNAPQAANSCAADSPTPLELAIPSTPITLGWFKSSSQAYNQVLFEWTTESEVANVGFHLWAQNGDSEWYLLNDQLIISQGDSLGVQRYQFLATGVVAHKFRLTDVGVTGKQVNHGPFNLGNEYGIQDERKNTNWDQFNRESNQKNSVRQLQRRYELHRRMQQLRLQQGNQMDMKHTEPDLPEVLPPERNKDKPSQPTRGFGKLLGLLLTSLVATADASELVTIDAEQAGIYRLTHQQLLSAGLDLSGITLNRIGLKENGHLVPVNIQPDGTNQFNSNSYIEFPTRELNTRYSGTNRYTLVLDEGQKRILIDDRPIPSGPAAYSYLAHKRYAPQNRHTHLSPDKNDAWYADRLLALTSSANKTVNLYLDDYAPAFNIPFTFGNYGPSQAQIAAVKPKLEVKLWGGSSLPGNGVTNPDHHVEIELNGKRVADALFDGLRLHEVSQPLEVLVSGTNRVKINVPNDNGQPFDLINLDEVSISYPRRFKANDSGRSLIFASSWNKFRIRNLESTNVTVYRVNISGEVSQMSTHQGQCYGSTIGCVVTFAGVDEESIYYVATQSGAKVPKIEITTPIENLFSGAANYLIIAHPDFINSPSAALESYAVELAGIYGSVDIVSVDSIYGNYSGHVTDARSIQKYIKQAYQNRGTRHVLLVGGDIYDYRNFLNGHAKSYVPSLYVRIGINLNSVPSDSKYADIDDDQVPDISISRLPVRSEQELSTLLAKRQSYLSRDYQRQAVFAADKKDGSGYSFKSDSEQMINRYFTQWQLQRAYVDDRGPNLAKRNLISKLNQGASLTSFFGHSSTNRWSLHGLFNGEDVAGLENSGKPTVVAQWGCWNTFYVSPDEDSMAHRFLVENETGAVVVMGASSLTSASAEKQMADLLYQRLDQGMRISDAVLSAKRAFAITNPYQYDVLLGWTVLGPDDLVIN